MKSKYLAKLKDPLTIKNIQPVKKTEIDLLLDQLLKEFPIMANKVIQARIKSSPEYKREYQKYWKEEKKRLNA